MLDTHRFDTFSLSKRVMCIKCVAQQIIYFIVSDFVSLHDCTPIDKLSLGAPSCIYFSILVTFGIRTLSMTCQIPLITKAISCLPTIGLPIPVEQLPQC